MFAFKSVGHFFASVVHDIKVGSDFLQHHQAAIDKTLETGAAIISVVDPALAPAAGAITRAGEAALGTVLEAVSKLDDAAAEHGTNIALDAAAIAEFRQLLAAIEKIKPGTIGTAHAMKPVPAPATA